MKYSREGCPVFPSSQRRGGRAQKIVPFRKRRGRGGQFGEIFRPQHRAGLTTITASRYRARASRPSAAPSVASQLLLDAAASPPLRGGDPLLCEEGNCFNLSK